MFLLALQTLCCLLKIEATLNKDYYYNYYYYNKIHVHALKTKMEWLSDHLLRGSCSLGKPFVLFVSGIIIFRVLCEETIPRQRFAF